MTKYLGIGLLAAVMLAAGCDRYIDDRDPVRSLPDDGPVPLNVKAFRIDGGVRLTWEMSDTAAVKRYRVYAAEIENDLVGEYLLQDSTSQMSVTLTDLTVNQEYAFRVAAVTGEGLEWGPSRAVKATVTYLSISLEEGAPAVNTRDVRVRLYIPTTTSHIRLSEDSTFADAVFIPFVGNSTTFEVSAGDGMKIVYAQLQFDDGSYSGQTLVDSILLDTRAEIDVVGFEPPATGTAFGPGDQITFFVNSNEIDGNASVSFSGVTSVVCYDDGTGQDAVRDDGIYVGTWTVPISFTLSAGEVTGRFIDQAGNQATPTTASSALNIFTPPLALTLSALPVSTSEISLTWTESSSDDFAAYRIYRDSDQGVSVESELITTITTIGTTSFTDTDLDANTEYFYSIHVYDNNGLSTGSAVVSAQTPVNTVPDPVDLFAVVGSDTTTVSLSWTRSEEEDFDSYRVYRSLAPAVDTTASLVLLERNQDIVTSSQSLPSVPLGSNQRYYFRVYVFDRHGAIAGSNVVDAAAPEE